MRENHVLASCLQSREAFDTIQKHVDGDDFTDQGRIVWAHICSYYDADPRAARVDPEIIGEAIARSLAVDKHKEMFKRIVESLSDMDASPANVVSDLIATKRDRIGQQLVAAILAAEPVEELTEKWNEILATKEFEDESEEEARRGYDVSQLVGTDFDGAGLVRISPDSLNQRLDGGVKRGHHLILFARPEMGKTMLVIEMMAGFARQGLTTLYVGNEDPIADINMRVVNRLSGMTKAEVIANPKEADRRAREKNYDSIILKAMAPGSRREITQLVEKYAPDVLVLDQLRNLDMAQDNYVLALEQAAKFARLIAKRYSCVVVSVTQAGDSATNKAVLDMGDVDFSNTGIPSQADLMIGLGANQNHLNNMERVISLPKNKISGRHEFFAVQVDPQLSSVLSLG